AQAVEENSRESLPAIRALGVLCSGGTRRVAASFSDCSFSAGRWRHAILPPEICGRAGVGTGSSLHHRGWAGGDLRQAHPPVLLQILQASTIYAYRVGGDRRNYFCRPVLPPQKQDRHGLG